MAVFFYVAGYLIEERRRWQIDNTMLQLTIKCVICKNVYIL